MSRKCCIPYCYKATQDPSVTLHNFPSNPDIAARWIQNINLFLKNGGTWFPQNDSVLCSAHFLPSDFNPNSKRKALKPRSVPTLFIWREVKPKRTVKKPEPKSPMIVKVLKPATSDDETDSALSPNSFQNFAPSVPASKDAPKLFKVTQVVGIPGVNLAPGSKLPFLPPNFIALPQKNFDLPSQNATVVDGQNNSAKNAGTVINMSQIKSPASLNSNQFIFLPQSFPPPNGGFIVLPNGKSLPPPGENVMIVRGNGPSVLNKNLIMSSKQQSALSSANSGISSKSLLINQNKEHPVSQNDSQKDFFKPNRSSTPISNYDDLTCEANSELVCNNDVSVSQTPSQKKTDSFELSTTNKEKSGSTSEIVSTQKRPLSNSDASAIERPCVKKRKPASIREQQSELIEIGPNTFMKINPDIIKVTKKQTPNGNTVLQFVMNPNIAKLDLKKPLFSFTNNDAVVDKSMTVAGQQISAENSNKLDVPDSTSQNEDVAKSNNGSAPFLVTTTLPIQHTFANVRMKYAKSLKLKSTQICRLTNKVKELEKKVDELENRCIVQERQLNFTSIKKLKTIKKDAEKGVPHANFILEQIRGYFGKNIRVNWSESTLVQCSIWCRKAPYAYEYFKKDDLFRLPARNTIKRFMERNPDVRLQIKNKAYNRNRNPDESSSSSDFDSDFDFDETDDENIPPSENVEESSVPVETILTVPQSGAEDSQSSNAIHFESNSQNVIHSKMGESSICIVPDYQPQLSNKGKADSNTTNKSAKGGESRQPLTNIFGKVLCEMGESIRKDTSRDDISGSVSSTSEKLRSNESDNILKGTSPDQSIATTITESNRQELMSINDGSSSHEPMAVADGSDSQGLMSVDDGSNSQGLMTTDDCSNNEELMTVDDFSNNPELMVTDSSDNQKLVTTNRPADSPLLMSSNGDSNIEASIVTNDDSNNYYLQTSERDGITTINVDGQEIVIPPGTILQLNSDLISTDELGNHFLIIPNADEQNTSNDHPYTENQSVDAETIVPK